MEHLTVHCVKWIAKLHIIVLDGSIIFHLYHYQLKDGPTLEYVGGLEDTDMGGRLKISIIVITDWNLLTFQVCL